jgi:hypothetical protein
MEILHTCDSLITLPFKGVSDAMKLPGCEIALYAIA